MNAWFRMYSEFASDPKVQSMSEVMQRRLVMIFCLRSSDVLVTLQDRHIAFALRVTEQELSETKRLFIDLGFIDEDWNVLNWSKRQFISDSSAERTRLYRERRKQASGTGSNVTVTSQVVTGVTSVTKRDAPDTDTDTDTDTEKNKRAAVVVSSGVVGTETPKPPSPKTGEGRAPVLAFDRQGVDSPGGERAGSGSSSVFELSKKQYFLTPASLFADWWQLWSKTRGTHHSREALEAWQQYVPPHLESAAIECTASYLDSLDHPAKGYNPHTFLKEQAREGFAPRWPPYIPRQPAQREGPTERSKRVIAERMVRNGRI